MIGLPNRLTPPLSVARVGWHARSIALEVGCIRTRSSSGLRAKPPVIVRT